ncbi:hypothetical protein Hanom_Chr12g01132041 [Helianthus anomalus]
MSFHEEDILALSIHQIRYNDKYEVCAKEWTSVAANILRHHLLADPILDLGGPQV